MSEQLREVFLEKRCCDHCRRLFSCLRKCSAPLCSSAHTSAIIWLLRRYGGRCRKVGGMAARDHSASRDRRSADGSQAPPHLPLMTDLANIPQPSWQRR